ncbi:serine/threonine protein phosphatase [Pseudoxanthomonas putridarboris]|uniref:Serine/threonine protein phosphatase n=1 Tax=Pseudoxanthomonas putridarboris TaxID=752605 RepID=A0ABU9J1S8_9GAMM
MVEAITLAGRRAWLKKYGTHHRGAALRMLDGLATRMDMTALRPPPHYDGEQAKQTEARRLAELRAQDILVPEVLGEGKASLILGDLGESLSARMRETAHDGARLDELTLAAAGAIRQAHRAGAYFGQPVPRNMTFDGARIGFIDFEEDPLEVMSLEQAQARDWLMFSYGAAKYYDDRPQAFAELLRRPLGEEPDAVSAHAHHVAGKLQKLARLSRHLGTSARSLAHAILVVHAATTFTLMLSVLLLFDWFSDGDLDLLQALI